MKYMIMLFGDESQFDPEIYTPEIEQADMQRHDDFASWCADNGITITSGEALQPSVSGQTLAADGTWTDGPFLETREQLGGFYVIECEDVEQAMEATRRVPNYGAVELRPVIDFGEEA